MSDLSARIEYAFYASDPAALRQALNSLVKLAGDDARDDLQLSSINYGRWKLAQLLASTNADEAGRLAESCVSAIPVKPTAEHSALAAACFAMLEELRPLRRVWYRGEREQRLKQALTLAPKNSQVQLVAAWIKTAREPDSQTTYAELKATVAAFGADNESLEEPQWGQAEAWYLLGKAELSRHDTLAARNALERASVIAPDYRAAQELLKKINVN